MLVCIVDLGYHSDTLVMKMSLDFALHKSEEDGIHFLAYPLLYFVETPIICTVLSLVFIYFLLRDAYASAIYALTLCPSVRVSATIQCSIETAEQIELFVGTQVSLGLSYTLCCNGIRVSAKMRVLPSGTLFQTLNLADFFLFRHSTSISRRKGVVNFVRPTTVASVSH